ncbi:MAG: cysteine desulfurase-like protein [Gaiellales bacterium]|jgi:cysteine desulfurase family protein (TIGR01976 family)|nr:cysteine desulfurase-like protein [Gaiellales bacterium]
MSTTSPTFDVAATRAGFPSLTPGRIHLDNPGGTQVHGSVIDAVTEYYHRFNANLGGPFETSLESDRVLASARGDVAALLGAEPAEIIFGANMTTLTFHVSRALTRGLSPGDEILLTRVDHDGNVAPWLLAAEDRGLTVRFADIDPDSCTIDVDDFAGQLSPRTRIAAFNWASNGAGTISDAGRLCELAREAGAISYVDAVQYAPHGPADVHALGCDFLACSAYKFFGPHVGVLYGRGELLASIEPYRVRPADYPPPQNWETGTVNLEGIAGTAAAARYLTSLGWEAISAHERSLTKRIIDGLDAIPGVTQYGTRDLDRRVATVVFTVEGRSPREVTEALAADGIFVWDGNYYALELMRRLGLDDAGGAVRVGAVHYNTAQEVDAFLERLEAVARR